jgi:2-(1,2-epoxy-1,2-dihydrophenyl)acetyl-CoA isomerase
MAYGGIFFEVKDGVGLIRLNRPEDGNAITLEMAGELLDAARHCDQEHEVRAVVLTGSGRMFCAGGDLKAFAAQGENVSRYLKKVVQAFHSALARFSRMEAPVVGAINGMAAGGGLSLALIPDIAIAGESAKFTVGYTKVGLTLDGGSSYYLARLVGLRRAKEMALLNPVLTARQALEWGLVNRVVADEDVLPAALELASELANGPTRAYGETKRLLLAGATADLEAQMEREARAIATLAGSPDGQEGMAAFMGKRTPRFTGQ